MFLVRLV